MSKTTVNVVRLAAKMKEKGYSIPELAEESGVKYDTVYSLIKGRRTNSTVETLQPLAAVLDTSVDYLLGNIDDDAPAARTPAAVVQLAAVATRLSSVAQSELIRMAEGLARIEREQRSVPLPQATMRQLLELSYELRDRGGYEEIATALQTLLRSQARGGGPSQHFDQPGQEQ